MTSDGVLLLVGTYCGLNKGDRLMQQVMIDGVLEVHPDTRVVLASPFQDVDREFYPRATVVKASRRNLPLALLKCLLLLLPYRIRIWLARRNDEWTRYLQADLVVDLSGDMLTEDYGVLIAISHAIPLFYARMLRRKYMVIAQSVGSFRWTSGLYRWLLRGAKAITVRDPISRRYLMQMQLANVQETSDLGFLLRPTNSASQIVATETAELRIGIAPSGLLLQKFSLSRNGTKSAIDEMAEMFNRLGEQFDVHFVLIPHVQSPRGNIDDAAVCQQLAQRLSAPSTQLNPELTPAEVKSYVGGLDLLIAYRMHAALAGLDGGIPTIAISYSHKTAGLYERLGLSHWVVKNDEGFLFALEGKVRELVDRRHEVVEQLRQVLPEVRDDAKKNVDLVIAELSRGA